MRLEVAGVQKVSEEYWSRITEKDPLVQEILKMSRDYTVKDVKMSWRGGVGGGRPDFWNLARSWCSPEESTFREAAAVLTHRMSTRTSTLWYLALA